MRTILSAATLSLLLVSPVALTAQDQQSPCTDPEYRQFDFWLGEWEVQNPDGNVVGKNTVTSRLSGCLLTEEWESVRGGLGFSINYYDNATGTWTQTYRDSTGNIVQWPDLVGGIVDGKMVLESVLGAEPMARWIWTPIGEDRVRQMAETSSDGGKTWQVVWDSYYVRK
jgi:hypothetical protein